VLFNEPKLLKFRASLDDSGLYGSFSALQRAEIAEIHPQQRRHHHRTRFSALQRAEIAEIGIRENYCQEI